MFEIVLVLVVNMLYMVLPIYLYSQGAITASKLKKLVILYFKFMQHMWCYVFKMWIAVGNIVMEIAVDLADFHKNIVDILTSDDTNGQGNGQGNDEDVFVDVDEFIAFANNYEQHPPDVDEPVDDEPFGEPVDDEPVDDEPFGEPVDDDLVDDEPIVLP